MKNDDSSILQQISLLDAKTDAILRQSTRKLEKNIEENWTIMYNDRIANLVLSDAPPSALKLFCWLAVTQNYEGKVYSTKTHIGNFLGLNKKTWISAFKWLEANDYIRISKVRGDSVITINPVVATKGKDRHKKIEAWLASNDPSDPYTSKIIR